MKKINIFLIIALLIIPCLTQAANLSKSVLEIGEYFTIEGTGFGELNSYSKICFNNGYICYDQADFNKDNFFWSDTAITLTVPSGVDIYGIIQIYIEGQDKSCYETTPGDQNTTVCSYTTVSKLKTLVDYQIKPNVIDIAPSQGAKPGETVIITGSGFNPEQNNGKIYFDQYEAYIASWGANSIEVEPPTIITSQTTKLKVSNFYQLTEVDYIVSPAFAPEEIEEEITPEEPVVEEEQQQNEVEPTTQPEENIDHTNVITEQEKQLVTSVDQNLSSRLKGMILLQVEEHGQSWYVNPKDEKKYYMANGDKAYQIMRYLSVGITNQDLNKIKSDKIFAKKHVGKIFLQVEEHGEAYYIDNNGNTHYLKDGQAAYEIMRSLSLGITNENIRKIEVGEIK